MKKIYILIGMDHEYIWHIISVHEEIESAHSMLEYYHKSLIGRINSFIDYEIKEVEITE